MEAVLMSQSGAEPTTRDRIIAAITQKPHMTEVEIRTAIFGEPYSHDINPTIRRLLKLGCIERHGQGGQGQTYRYTIRGGQM
jgi:predicted HTH transcriptional regulator